LLLRSSRGEANSTIVPALRTSTRSLNNKLYVTKVNNVDQRIYDSNSEFYDGLAVILNWKFEKNFDWQLSKEVFRNRIDPV
jgi:hypothetical protein